MVVIMAALLGIFAHVVLTQTAYGRVVFALGGNRETARLSGINVQRITIWIYVICGAASGLTGVLTAAARDGYLKYMASYPDFKMVVNEFCNSDTHDQRNEDAALPYVDDTAQSPPRAACGRPASFARIEVAQPPLAW